MAEISSILSNSIELKGIIYELKITEKEFKKAVRLTLGDVARTIAKRITALTASEAKVMARLIKKRVKHYINRSGDLYAYINAISSDMPLILQNPRKTKRGLKAKGKIYPGSFLGSGIDSGKMIAFERRGKARLPLDKVMIELEPAFKKSIDKEMANFDSLFMSRFRRNAKRVKYLVG